MHRLRQRPAAVLLDLDGTLIDSRDYWFAVVADCARAFGNNPVDRACFDRSFGQSASADQAEFVPAASVEQVASFYDAAFATHGHMVRMLDGAETLLDALMQHSLRTAVVTNSTLKFAHAVLQQTGMAPRVTAVACADEAPPKPSADLVHLAASRLGAPVQQCWLVGDSRFDVEAARAAGALAVGLHVAADVTVTSLHQVVALVQATNAD